MTALVFFAPAETDLLKYILCFTVSTTTSESMQSETRKSISTTVMLELVLYSINYKTTCFGWQWLSSGFINPKNALRWCYIICVTVCWWRDLIISIPFYGYCCNIGWVGKSCGQYM